MSYGYDRTKTAARLPSALEHAEAWMLKVLEAMKASLPKGKLSGNRPSRTAGGLVHMELDGVSKDDLALDGAISLHWDSKHTTMSGWLDHPMKGRLRLDDSVAHAKSPDVLIKKFKAFVDNALS